MSPAVRRQHPGTYISASILGQERIEPANQSSNQQRSKVIGQRQGEGVGVEPALHWPLSLQVLVCSMEAGEGGREGEGEGRGRVDPARGLMSCLMGRAPQSPRSPAPAPSPG